MRFHRGRLFALTVAALTAAGTVHVSPLTAHARPIPGASPAAVVNSHGVRMALTIPKRSYPRDSLVQVTLRLRNVSRHAVLVSTNNGPSVQVLDGAGNVVYQPTDPLGSLELFSLLGGPRRPPHALRPGHSLVTSTLVVLRGPVLQGGVDVVGSSGVEHAVHGPTVRLTLTEESAPTVTVVANPTVQAMIVPPTGVTGPPSFTDQVQCGAVGTADTGLGWQFAPGDTLMPAFPAGCSGPRAWVALVGWIGHPIATINWRQD